jgi:hypothetical protein
VKDFGALLYSLVPGIYRLKDDRGELQRFLAIMAAPLGELEESIGQLYEDLFAETCRPELIAFVGSLIGADIDPTLPPSQQRATLIETFAFFRSKGLAQSIEQIVAALTSWATVAVDFSEAVARVPFVDTLNPLLRRRDQPVGESPPGSGNFYFSSGKLVTPLYDERRGRAIARADIASPLANIVGTSVGFAIKDRGVDLVGPAALLAYAAVPADLSDFTKPKTPTGSALTLAPQQIAIDPQLGRFMIAPPTGVTSPLAGNLTVDFHQLVPTSTVPETFDISDSTRMAQLGRSDDPAPYTIDLRSPTFPSDKIGRPHFDNQGLFLTIGRAIANQAPYPITPTTPPTTLTGFTFDNRPPPATLKSGISLMLQDGVDGSPITRSKLSGNEDALFDTLRGFTIRALNGSLRDLASSKPLALVTADLSDFDHPKDLKGNPLATAFTGIYLDPELGRFMLIPSAFGLQQSQLRVGYLLAQAVRQTGSTPYAIGTAAATVFSFGTDASVLTLRDGFDGTPIAAKLNIAAHSNNGISLADFHGTARGYTVWRNGVDLTAQLTPELKTLDGPGITASAGKLAIDPLRGRFALPTPPAAGDVLTVDFSVEDRATNDRIFAQLAQHLPRLVPAGVAPVVVDTRKATVDPKSL